MRVGILTYHSSYNFGANLQTLATQAALVDKGASPIVINYREPAKTEAYRQTIIAEQAEKHEAFINKYLRLSPLLTNEKDVKAFCIDALDAVLVGSDAVFRLMPKYEPIHILNSC